MADDNTDIFNIDEPEFDTPEAQPAPHSNPVPAPTDRPAPGESLNEYYARLRGETPRAPEPATKSDRGIKEERGDKEDKEPESVKSVKSDNPQQPPKGRSWLTILLICAVVGALGAIWIILARNHREAMAQNEQIEQLELANQQLALQNDYDALNKEFEGYENQTRAITNDTALMRVQEKYNAARLKVEALLKELKDTKSKSAAQISKLNDEIATLKGILRHYVEEIDRLSKENAALREENSEIKSENASLTSQVATTTAQNRQLNERMTLAEKLNVTNVTLQALNSKGKHEKKIKKAKQLVVNFTIPQNNSTPVGQKAIYLRLTSPTGQLLGQSGTFAFEGAQVPYSERKYVEYAGEEITAVPIYWNVDAALTPGQYTVELFTDGYRLASKHFNL